VDEDALSADDTELPVFGMVGVDGASSFLAAFGDSGCIDDAQPQRGNCLFLLDRILGVIRGRGDDELGGLGERVPTALAIGHDEPDVFYRRTATFKAISKRWAQLPAEGWQFVASCCHRGDTVLGTGGMQTAVEPANATRASGLACAQAHTKTAAVVRRGAAPARPSFGLSSSSTAAAPQPQDGGPRLAVSSIVFCSSVAIAFLLVRSRRRQKLEPGVGAWGRPRPKPRLPQ